MNDWALPTIAVLLIGYGALSGRLQSTVITQAMVFVGLGLLVGNQVLQLVDVDAANQFVRLLAEATLALVLFTDARPGQPGQAAARGRPAAPVARPRLAPDDRGRHPGRAGLVSPSWTGGPRLPWPPSWPPPTPPSGSRWSPTSGSLPHPPRPQRRERPE